MAEIEVEIVVRVLNGVHNLQGNLRKREEPKVGGAKGQVPVYIYRRSVRYRWVYCVPAALCVLLTAIICVAALVAVLSGKGNLSRLRYYLNRLSAGRLLVALKLGDHDYDSSSKDWLEASGKRRLSLSGKEYENVPMEEQHVIEAKHDNNRSLMDTPTERSEPSIVAVGDGGALISSTSQSRPHANSTLQTQS